MTLLALEINDAGLLARREGAAPRDTGPSPGFALLEGDTLLTGEAARARSRLRPRQIDHRFWSELDTTPLGGPVLRDRSRADLAHAHLAALWREAGVGVDGVILALSGAGTERQLGLILGISRACAIPVRGLVDAAVAAASGAAGDELVHVDVQLHQVVATRLGRDPDLVRRKVVTSTRAGLIVLQDAWARRIADSFVRRTRFDPLHAAESEQALYDGLPEVLERLEHEACTSIELVVQGKPRTVEVTRDELVAAVRARYDAVVRLVGLVAVPEHTSFLLSHRAARLPGLGDLLAELGDVAPVRLDPHAATAGALAHRDAIVAEGEALPFVTRLPWGDGSAVGRAWHETRPRPRLAERSGATPTHVLLDGVAHPLGDEPLVVGIDVPPDRRALRLTGNTAGISRVHCSLRAEAGRIVVEDRSRHGSFLNGRRIRGRSVLIVGDRLRLGSPGVELRLIRVVDENGATQD